MTEPGMIARYEWKQLEVSTRWTRSGDEYSEYDEVCIDRLSGLEIVRYDLGDPANYAASHGGWSKRQYLERQGRDPDAEIDIVDSKVPVPASEVKWHAERKARKAQRAREEEARDLLEFLGTDADNFSFDDYDEGELDILRPALESRGFANIGFYMVEEDSFGPLIRGCRAIDTAGKTVRFFYG